MTKNQQDKWQKIIATAVVALILLGVGKWLYYDAVYLKPETVFWSCMNQNLQTGSVTITSNLSSDASQTVVQVANMQFKASLYAQTTVTIEDKTAGKQSLVITDTFGTPTQDYLMYRQIKTPDSNVPSGVVGVWAASSTKENGQSQVLSDAILASPIMFGYLDSSQRAKLIDQMRTNKVFTVDFNATKKGVKVNGKNTYAYAVTIDMQKYIAVYKNYLAMIGQTALGNQLGQAQVGDSYKATLYIAPVSRQPLRLLPEGSKNGQDFSNFGNNNFGQPPKNVELTISQLQSRITGQPQ